MTGRIDPHFVELVDEMRKAQRKYFDGGNQKDLAAAKVAERRVDKWIEGYREDEKRLRDWLGKGDYKVH